MDLLFLQGVTLVGGGRPATSPPPSEGGSGEAFDSGPGMGLLALQGVWLGDFAARRATVSAVVAAAGTGGKARRGKKRVVEEVINGIRFVGTEEALARLAGRIEPKRTMAQLEPQVGLPHDAVTVQDADLSRFDPGAVIVPDKVGKDSRALKIFTRNLKAAQRRARRAAEEDEELSILLLLN